jgi:hypothetical protein
MSPRPASLAELDDAAFRARLAPLAREVLPDRGGQGPAAGRQSGLRVALRLMPVPETALPGTGAQPAALRPDADPSARRGRPRVLAGAAVATALLIAGGVYVTPPTSPLRGHAVPAMAPLTHEASAPAAPFAAAPPSLRDAQAAPSAAAAPSLRAAPAAPSAAAAPPRHDAPARSLSSAATAPSTHDAPGTIAPSAAAAPAGDMVSVLLRRGDAALASGDITAARLLFARAAAQGSAVAAMQAAKTYDIAFLLEIGAHGIQADQDQAAAWYRAAAALGEPTAQQHLRRLEGQQPP